MSQEIVLEVRPATFKTPAFAQFHTWITREPLNPEKTMPLERRVDGLFLQQHLEQQIGDIAYEVRDYQKEIDGQKYFHRELHSTRFFPFSAHFDYQLPFVGKGVADVVQLKVALDLFEEYGSGFSVIHQHPADQRQIQLKRLGINKNEWYPLAKYVGILRNKVIVF